MNCGSTATAHAFCGKVGKVCLKVSQTCFGILYVGGQSFRLGNPIFVAKKELEQFSFSWGDAGARSWIWIWRICWPWDILQGTTPPWWNDSSSSNRIEPAVKDCRPLTQISHIVIRLTKCLTVHGWTTWLPERNGARRRRADGVEKQSGRYWDAL